MKLYTMPGTCALSVHIALEWAAAPYDLAVMDRGDNRKPEYLAINPSGEVPAIVLDDGKVLTQASALLVWIAESHPDAKLDTANNKALERFELAELLAYLTSEVHVAFGPFFAPSRYLDDEGRFEALKTMALKQVANHMETLDRKLGGKQFILNDRRTVADAYLYVLTRWADNLPEGIAPYANLARFRQSMQTDPAVRHALHAQGMPLLG